MLPSEKPKRKLSDYKIWFEPLFETLIKHANFQSDPDLKEILQQKKLVIIFNHATPMSWLPAMVTLSHQFILAGGESRVPVGIVDRWFHSNPFTHVIAEYLTNSSRPSTFENLVTELLKDEVNDLVLMPEGANTFFGDPNELQDFRSTRFLDIAIRTGSPILVCVHRGSEHWSVPLEVPESTVKLIMPFAKFFGPKLMENNKINFPVPFGKIDKFSMKCKLYYPDPNLTRNSVHEKDYQIHIQAEAEKIRQLMLELSNSLLS